MLRALGVSLAFLLGVSSPAAPPSPAPARTDEIAEAYVKLVLALGARDPGYVDAYYGPQPWRTQAEASPPSVEAIGARAEALAAGLEGLPRGTDEVAALRHDYLLAQLRALAARASLVSGAHMSFDEESRALYDAVAPRHDEAEFRQVLQDLERALPGEGPLLERYKAFRDRFQVPREKLASVFQAAIDECRRRTLAHVELPPGESFEVEYVGKQPWGAYNWYKGNYHSLIQVNTDLPITIDRAVDMACHEGYPGHHVYNALLEQALVRGRGYVEFQVYPLYSPQSLIAEGSANFGVDVAFPGGEGLAFERGVLYPLAGLDPARAPDFAAVQALVRRLDYATNEAARQYLDGKLDEAATLRWIETFTLRTPERARQSLDFIRRYRSYVINYNLGRDLVRAYVEGHGGTPQHPEKRWQVFKELLSSPRLPGGLR